MTQQEQPLLTHYQEKLHEFAQKAEARGQHKLAACAREMLRTDIAGEDMRDEWRKRGWIAERFEQCGVSK